MASKGKNLSLRANTKQSSQLKLNIIPEYEYANLYTELVKSPNFPKMLIGSGYNGKKTLTFYDDRQGDMWTEIGFEIDFPDFPTAYKYILDNKIKVHNIRCGSYKEEIKQFKKEYENNAPLCVTASN